ncbi:MAG: DUF1549 domain-containing protein, partial [Verrucomicrobiota bacterium]
KSIVLLVFPLSLEAEVSYKPNVEPILREHCYDCHGGEEQKSNLRLDSPVQLLKGGDSGEPVFIPGNSAESYLIKRVQSSDPDHRMPPKGKGLSEGEMLVLKDWIEQGAKLPDTPLPTSIETDHWSFRSITRPQPPGENGNAIDGFVRAKLREKSLKLSPEADRATLIRRLYLIAHGLPPTPAETRAFLEDRRPDAYETLVARVLESPRYGERWARHWLDVVRYADTNGFETNRQRKTAYHYRDYVIKAFNEDKPYDQFITEQLAGDTVGADVGTGFLVAGPYDIVKSPDINLTLMQRQDELTDMVNTTGTAFLGLTLGCARCHNHKFDPVLQKDFYALQAVFAGVTHGERKMKLPLDPDAAKKIVVLEKDKKVLEGQLTELKSVAAERGEATKSDRPLRDAVQPRINEESFKPQQVRHVRFTIQATSGGEPCIDEWEIYSKEGENIALTAEPSASGSLKGYPIHQLKHINDGRLGNNFSWISNTSGRGWVQLTLKKPQTIVRMKWGRDRNGGFSDRLATKYVIEGSLDGDQWQKLSSSEDRKPFSGKSDPL